MSDKREEQATSRPMTKIHITLVGWMNLEDLPVQMRFSPRPFLMRSLVVEACAIIFPPIGLVESFAKLIPSGFATTKEDKMENS